MAKKRSHTYNCGDIVTFKFLTGDTYTGAITELTWKEDDTPSYKIKVDDKIGNRNGFTIYPCILKLQIYCVKNMIKNQQNLNWMKL